MAAVAVSTSTKGQTMLITIAEAAELLAVSPRTVRREMTDGELPYVQVRGAPRIDRSELDAYISRKTVRREVLHKTESLASVSAGYHSGYKSRHEDSRELLLRMLGRRRKP